MNRYFILAVMGVMVAGCAAEFGEDGTDPVVPDQIEESQGGSIRTFNGQLMRPAQTLGTVDDAPVNLQAAKLINYYETVEQSDIELGGRFARSTK